MGNSSVKIFSVTSGRGGTGKSFVAYNLAMAFAKLDKKVLAIDLDIGMRSLDLYFNLEDNIVFDLSDVIAGKCIFTDAVYHHSEYRNLSLLCGPATLAKDFCAQSMFHIIKTAIENSKYNMVIIDLPAGIGFNILATTQINAQPIIVTNPSKACVRGDSTLSRAFLDNKENGLLVINKIGKSAFSKGEKGEFNNLDEIIDKIGFPLLAALPYNAPKGFTQYFDAIAQRLLGNDVPLLLRVI